MSYYSHLHIEVSKEIILFGRKIITFAIDRWIRLLCHHQNLFGGKKPSTYVSFNFFPNKLSLNWLKLVDLMLEKQYIEKSTRSTVNFFYVRLFLTLLWNDPRIGSSPVLISIMQQDRHVISFSSPLKKRQLSMTHSWMLCACGLSLMEGKRRVVINVLTPFYFIRTQQLTDGPMYGKFLI